jgi:hypothetical protein
VSPRRRIRLRKAETLPPGIVGPRSLSDIDDMNTAENLDQGSEEVPGDGLSAGTSAAERLETALGGDLTRFLLSALAGAQPTARPTAREPR